MKNFKKGLILSLLMMGGILLLSGVSNAFDFNLSTQQTDLRARTATPNDPGFDPCQGGTRSAAGACSGGSGLLKPSNLTSDFPALGPGAVTDNMFGIIGNISLAPTTCGTNQNPGDSFTPNALNCGNMRLTPTNQGQTLPSVPTNTAGAAINTLSGAFTANTDMKGDFCASGKTDCDPGSGQLTAAHAGFDIQNHFTWTPTSPSPSPSATVTSNDTMEQVTALSAPIGTLASPGTGDQRVKITTSFSTTSSASSTDVDGTFTPPTVTWTQIISDPDMSGTGIGFSQNISGSFLYNSTGDTASYPSGASQTVRSTGSGSPTEFLCFKSVCP